MNSFRNNRLRSPTHCSSELGESITKLFGRCITNPPKLRQERHIPDVAPTELVVLLRSGCYKHAAPLALGNGGKAAANAPQFERFARFADARQARQRLEQVIVGKSSVGITDKAETALHRYRNADLEKADP